MNQFLNDISKVYSEENLQLEDYIKKPKKKKKKNNEPKYLY